METLNHSELPSSKDFRHSFQAPRIPAVFRQGTPESLAEWAPARLASEFGDVMVPVQRSEQLTGADYGSIEESYESVPLRAFIGSLDLPDAGYLSQFPFEITFPELHSRAKFPDYSSYFHRTNLWIGPKGTNSKFHYDCDENLFWQVYGEKRVILAPPSDTPNLYPTNVSWGDGYSPVDPKAPDYEQFPMARNASYLDVRLGPGDLLYIPPMWWHDVTSLTTSVSINRLWWPLPLLARNVTLRELERFWRFFLGKTRHSYGPPTLKRWNTL